MMNNPNMKKVLTSRQEIMDFIGISQYLFKKFIKLGMPVLYLNGRCLAHKDNIDDFFRSITRVSVKNVPDEILNKDDDNKPI